MDCFSLTKYEIQDATGGQVLVLFTGNQIYKTVLARAVQPRFVSRVFDDRRGRYEWGTYIHDVDAEVHEQIRHLLQLAQQHLLIQDDLTETFALAYHTEMSSSGDYARTSIGELVYSAKPYNRAATPTNHEKALELAQHFITFIKQHPTYSRADVVVPVASRAGKSFDLPTKLVEHIAAECGMEEGSGYVQKVRVTRPMKDCSTPREKIDNVRDAFAVRNDVDLEGRNIILIDDVYQSGFTINEVGQVLFEAGASNVFGLVATKTVRDV
jgi:glutamine phosphoribosylpyrophosphate amidotransferase